MVNPAQQKYAEQLREHVLHTKFCFEILLGDNFVDCVSITFPRRAMQKTLPVRLWRTKSCRVAFSFAIRAINRTSH